MMSLQCQCSPADSDSAPVIRRRTYRPLSAWLYFFSFQRSFCRHRLLKHSPLIRSESGLTPWDQLQRRGAHYNLFFFFLIFFVLSVCCSVSSPQTVDLSPTMYLRACACVWKAKLSCTVISAAHLVQHIAKKKKKEERQTSRWEWTVFYLPVCICHQPNSCQSLKLWFEIFSSLTHMQPPPPPPPAHFAKVLLCAFLIPRSSLFFFFNRPDSGEVYSPVSVSYGVTCCDVVQCNVCGRFWLSQFYL